LKWARPEWVKPPGQPNTLNPPPPPSPAAAASLRPGSSVQSSAAALQRRQRLVNKATYGSFKSTGNGLDDAGTSKSQQQQQQQQLFQAMAVDFGVRRIGLAVRRSSHNVPLLTLHRQQDTGTSDSSSSQAQQKQQQQQQPRRQPGAGGSHSSSRSTARNPNVLPLRRTAAVVLHLALQEGCDGFVIGLPVYTDSSEPAGTAAAAARSSSFKQPGGAGTQTAAAAAGGDGNWINPIIRGFAQTLADLAVPLELPVLLVNEAQSSQQARAVMAGAAAYDVRSQAELDAEQAAASAGGQQQQMTKQQRHELQKQHDAVGRDAFAAALILSRYYNGLVQPIQQLQGSSAGSNSSGDGDSSSSDNSSSSSSSSSSSQQGSWVSKKVQQQAAADLKWMLLSPREQRRRREQREQMKAAAAALNETTAPVMPAAADAL
jgi:RNase H-fold protein (predicted Holliday junction resolvase)